MFFLCLLPFSTYVCFSVSRSLDAGARQFTSFSMHENEKPDVNNKKVVQIYNFLIATTGLTATESSSIEMKKKTKKFFIFFKVQSPIIMSNFAHSSER